MLAVTAGSAGLSHCGRARHFQSNGHSHCSDMGTCHLRGTSFEGNGGKTPWFQPRCPDEAQLCWHNSHVGFHLHYHSWHQPGGSGTPKFSLPAVLQLMESLIGYKLCLQWANMWKRGQSARLGSGKHLEALGQWLLCVQGSSSSTDMVFKLMRAEIGVLQATARGTLRLQRALKDK